MCEMTMARERSANMGEMVEGDEALSMGHTPLLQEYYKQMIVVHSAVSRYFRQKKESFLETIDRGFVSTQSQMLC